MKLVAWAKLYINKPSEGGISYSFRGRVDAPAIFHNDRKNAWSLLIIFDQMTIPGEYFECPVILLVDEKSRDLFVVGNKFDYFPQAQKGGTGEIISIKEVSEEEMREIFKLDIWPGNSMYIFRE